MEVEEEQNETIHQSINSLNTSHLEPTFGRQRSTGGSTGLSALYGRIVRISRIFFSCEGYGRRLWMTKMSDE